MSEGKLYAKEGERVTCEDGHHICTLAADIPLYSTGALKADWHQPEPKIGDQPVCKICGKMWFAGHIGLLETAKWWQLKKEE